MKRLNKFFLMTLLIALACVGACKRDSVSNEQRTAGDNTTGQAQQAEGGTMPQGQTKFFTGSIGTTLGLQMKLLRAGESLTGSYYYQKVGTKIDLRGTVDKDGNVVLAEFDPGGKQTGVFEGSWKTEDSGLVAINGNWKAPNSTKQIKFYLQEEPIEFSSGVEIVVRRITENNKKLKYKIDAQYPQLTGSGSPNYEKFNQTVRDLVTKKVSAFKQEMVPDAEDEPTDESSTESAGSDLDIAYKIDLAKDDLISIRFVVGSYSAGAAHPNSYSEVVNFDLRNGKLLKLADLFQPGSKHLQTLAAFCIAALKGQGKQNSENSLADDDWIQRGAGPEAENYSSWTIGKKGLGIIFDAYQVASYAEGPQYVLVPYSALKDIIKADGPLAQFVK
jgi:uncharacterized protein DUF3298/peptidoglycan-N-acetylmuramic acid deacetylase PdaC-like protein